MPGVSVQLYARKIEHFEALCLLVFLLSLSIVFGVGNVTVSEVVVCVCRRIT